MRQGELSEERINCGFDSKLKMFKEKMSKYRDIFFDKALRGKEIKIKHV